MLPQKTDFQTCSVSTTASNSTRVEKSALFEGEVICDWLSFRHDFAFESPTNSIHAGKTLKINSDGKTEWEKNDFSIIRCSSSDTSVRIKCDGRHLHFSGNIGRFAERHNITGLTLIQCFEKALDLIKAVYPQIDTRLFGTISRQGTISEYGTYLTRIDLASNFYTDNYSQIAQVFSVRKLGTRLPVVGKYGPTWGYDTKRGQYWKAKLYDKQAEQDAKRTPYIGETTARFELQLGSEYLRQNGLNTVIKWGDDTKTENVIYGKFVNQLLVEQATGIDLLQLKPSLRQHYVVWRDGTDPRTYLQKSMYYRVRKQLLELGLDISRPCNVLNLTQKVKFIKFQSIPTLRRVA